MLLAGCRPADSERGPAEGSAHDDSITKIPVAGAKSAGSAAVRRIKGLRLEERIRAAETALGESRAGSACKRTTNLHH